MSKDKSFRFFNWIISRKISFETTISKRIKQFSFYKKINTIRINIFLSKDFCWYQITSDIRMTNQTSSYTHNSWEIRKRHHKKKDFTKSTFSPKNTLFHIKRSKKTATRFRENIKKAHFSPRNLRKYLCKLMY